MHFVEAKGILSANCGMNVYRGCTHGCIYCDSRSRCYHMDHAFEDIEVKINAPELLDAALRKKRERRMIGTGAMCDPYMPLEAELNITRRCLEVIRRRGCGVAVQTKSDLILRDIDLLAEINERTGCVVQTTLTTYSPALCRILEPNVCDSAARAAMLVKMRERGIPTIVWLSPFLPFINDTWENILGLIKLCSEAGVYGVIFFGVGLTLREGNREYYYAKLDERFPGLKARYAARYGDAYEVASPRNAELSRLLAGECERRGIVMGNERLFAYMRAPRALGEQLSFF